MARERDGTTRRCLRTLFGVGTMTGLTDGQLLERFADGRGEAAEFAFSALIERHGPMVLRTCRAILRGDHEAEDAFQATFLVLVIKAGSFWVQDSLGPWLHRVACRIAVRAKSAADRRRETERRAAEMARSSRGDEDREELGPILHAEIDRLPSRHRIPVVLCDLEGRTYEEAARHLGCPIGTIKSRLARGRERLRGRLVRRGLAPAVGAFGTVLFAGEVPAALVESTSRAAAARALTAGVVPGSVTELTRGALKAMRHSMIMRIGGIVLVVGLAAAGRFAPRASGGPVDEPQGKVSPAEPRPAGPKAQPDPEQRREELAIRRAQQEVEEIEYEAKKEWLREAMKRLGQLELQRRVREPRPEKEETLRERREARQNSEESRAELAEYIEMMKKELIQKGISVNMKKLELLEKEEAGLKPGRPGD
jgi:RNA polymerase sigma factor (sigma-70 family)